jgi:hypothetical protein
MDSAGLSIIQSCIHQRPTGSPGLRISGSQRFPEDPQAPTQRPVAHPQHVHVATNQTCAGELSQLSLFIGRLRMSRVQPTTSHLTAQGKHENLVPDRRRCPEGAVVSNVTWPLRAVVLQSRCPVGCQATRNLTAIRDRSLGSCPSRAHSSVCNFAFDTTRCTPRALHRGAAATRQATETSDEDTTHRPTSHPPLFGAVRTTR